ncbi:hypothetical protein D9757_006920 [Collybiopsis confluens]|uniref:Uncharacterized protein n=1 Tax=Collybiopsis confluens TaxID=2823264 RepID=A0A8H5HIT6_9AGAR|nr:hypothetical protein D9757_006920 [Collybiopsis confluens]
MRWQAMQNRIIRGTKYRILASPLIAKTGITSTTERKVLDSITCLSSNLSRSEGKLKKVFQWALDRQSQAAHCTVKDSSTVPLLSTTLQSRRQSYPEGETMTVSGGENPVYSPGSHPESSARNQSPSQPRNKSRHGPSSSGTANPTNRQRREGARRPRPVLDETQLTVPLLC